MSDAGKNAHKEMAETGNYPGLGKVGSGPTLASTAGATYSHPPSMAMGDSQRAHKGRGGKSKPSGPGDVEHGHKWS